MNEKRTLDKDNIVYHNAKKIGANFDNENSGALYEDETKKCVQIFLSEIAYFQFTRLYNTKLQHKNESSITYSLDCFKEPQRVK